LPFPANLARLSPFRDGDFILVLLNTWQLIPSIASAPFQVNGGNTLVLQIFRVARHGGKEDVNDVVLVDDGWGGGQRTARP
jgi:hypothetical protein